MKNNNNYVPQNGRYTEDTGPRLASWKFVPDNADPTVLYDLPKETIYIEEGDNPFDYIEAMVSKEEMHRTWIIIEKPVLELARKIPGIYHFDRTISNPEVFNFNSNNFVKTKIIHLNDIDGFENWKIVCAWMGRRDKDFVVPVGNNPDKIVKVVMY